jgi:putative transposase
MSAVGTAESPFPKTCRTSGVAIAIFGTMPHTHIDNTMHFVFSTKDRRPFIKPALQLLLWPYMGGIARHSRIRPIIIGGMEDHVHMLLALPSDIDPATAMRLIKGGSSKWFREQHVSLFGWQQGFGAFSVSHSLVPKTIRYIQHQEQHHRKIDFRTEYRLLINKHGIRYDERYLW